MVIRRVLGGFLTLAVLVCLAAPGAGKDDTKKDDTKKADQPQPAADKATLKWKFEKGKPFYQTMTTTTDQSMNVMNNEVKQKQTQTFYFKWTPLDDPKDGKVKIKQEITGVKMDIDIGNQKITYDSNDQNAKNQAHPLSEFFKALVGSEFTLTLDTKTMKVEDIEGRDQFVEKLTKANAQMKPLLEQILSKDALKQMADPTFGVIKNGEEVAKNATWDRTSSLNMGPIGTYDNKYTYTYEGKDEKDKKLDKIKVTTTLTYKPPQDNPAGAAALPFKIKSAQLSSKNAGGEVYFNNETGRIDHSDMKVELEGTLNIEIGGQTTEVKLSQTQNSSITTSDKPPFETKPTEPKTQP